MTTIGIIGAGNIGSNVAKAAIAAGYDVVISNSRGPETLTDLVAELGPKARAATAEDAAASGDFVLVAVPLGKNKAVPWSRPRRQGRHRRQQLLPAARRPASRRSTPTSRPSLNSCRRTCLRARGEGVQQHSRARISPLTACQPASQNRRALPIASNDADAMVTSPPSSTRSASTR